MKKILFFLITLNLTFAKQIIYIWTGSGFNRLADLKQRDMCRKHFALLETTLKRHGYKMIQAYKFKDIRYRKIL